MNVTRQFVRTVVCFLAGLGIFLFSPQKAYSYHPDTCWVGIYVVNIYDIQMDSRSFSADFWVWKKYRSDSPLCNVDSNYVFDYANAKEYNKEFSTVLDKKGFQIRLEKIRAVLTFNSNGSEFPFDHQVLSIVLEEPEYDTVSLIYVPDIADCGIDDSVNMFDWKIDKAATVQDWSRCETRYGNPKRTGGFLVYSRVIEQISISRESPFTTFMKLCTATFVSLLVSLLVFLVRPDVTDTRFGLPIGALIAAVANNYVIANIIPETSRITLLDMIHVATFLLIMSIIFISILSLNFFQKGDEKSLRISKRIDRVSMVTIFIIYVVFVFGVLWKYL